MNSNDLFSFLDDAAEDDEINNEEPMEQDRPPKSSLQKRKADTPPPAVDAQTDDADVNMDGAGPSVPKKPRISSPKPVVLDDFETEAKREVAASAGLTGTAEAGPRLELKHQARISFHARRLMLIRAFIGSPPSGSTSWV
jgi:ATP-dependent RNA helicase DOB1